MKNAMLVVVALFFVSGAVNITTAYGRQPTGAVPEIRPGLLMGYLPKEALPNSLLLLPPPPPAGSVAFALDEDFARKSLAQRGTPRWTQAAVDADLSFPNAAGIFSCALKARITEERTPHLYVLLRRTLTDAGLSTYAAKDHYQRKRPSMVNKEPICTPAEQADIEKEGSYPSGHASVRWAWAVILSEIAPRQTDAILARGASKTYKVHLPPNIPAKNFWSIMVYDNQTRSELQTDQQYPSLGSQKKSLVINPDTSVDVYFGPTAPTGKEANWIQTIPGKGWNPMLRLYGPLEPWFDKTWRPGEIELMK
jgi:hypothetical protein